MLVSAGHTVEVVTSPLEALKRFEVGKYDVVVTDFMMPEMTGLQLAEQIKKRCAAQPILLFTGTLPVRSSTAIDLVLLKPSSTHEIREAVKKLTPLMPP